MDSFNKVSTQPLYPGANHLITQILQERPKLHRWGFLVPARGKSAITVMTETEVFKGPRQPGDAAAIKRECALLQSLQGLDMGVTVPDVKMVGRDNVFYAMPRLQATALTAARLAMLPEEEQDRIADSIGVFNARLSSSATPQGAAHNAVTPARIEALLCTEYVFDALGGDMQLFDRLAAYYLQQPVNAGMLLHNDLHHDNILYDDTTGEVSVIDIGEGRALPPEHSFGILRAYYTPAFAARAMAAFARETGIVITNDDLDIHQGLQEMLNLPQYEPEEAQAAWKKLSPVIAAALDRKQDHAIAGPQAAALPSSALRR